MTNTTTNLKDQILDFLNTTEHLCYGEDMKRKPIWYKTRGELKTKLETALVYTQEKSNERKFIDKVIRGFYSRRANGAFVAQVVIGYENTPEFADAIVELYHPNETFFLCDWLEQKFPIQDGYTIQVNFFNHKNKNFMEEMDLFDCTLCFLNGNYYCVDNNSKLRQ